MLVEGIMSYEILLASRSPRRAMLLQELGVPYKVVDTAHSEEKYPSHLKGGDIAQFLADHKSSAYVESLFENQILLTADTIVWHRDQELGKPSDKKEAISMIQSLAGDTHQVYTGVCLRSHLAKRSFFAVTDVTFSCLEFKEIESYVNRFLPYDKAGSYGIQEWIGYIAVEKIVGSYFNVMGLPVQKVYSELKSFIANLTKPD